MTPMTGTVITSINLNVRGGSPSTSAPIVRRVFRGESVAVTSLVEGESVQGNNHWYGCGDNSYIWSGGTAAFEPDVATSGAAAAIQVRRRPNGTVRPLREAEIRAVYGDIQVTESGGGRVALDPAWVGANMTSLALPLLANQGFPSLDVHVKALAAFQGVFGEIAAKGLSDRILTCGGTFVPRHIGWDSTRPLSSHTWGIAIDLNTRWNGYGAIPAAVGEIGSLREVVQIFESYGFAWGGYFEPQKICDGMHFELARLDI